MATLIHDLSDAQIGFVGLGAMGFGMATQLVSSGYKVKGFDVYAPQVNKFVTRGGLAASSPKDAASASNVFVVMVATAAQVHEALFSSSGGAVHGLEPGSLVILCSTVSPEDVYEFRSQLPEHIRFVDAPVSGGAARAANGTLTILASGSKCDIAFARPILEAMAGKETLHIIPSKGATGDLHEIGNGMKAKTVHQTLAGIHIAMTAESLGLGVALGVDIQDVVKSVTSSSSLASSWMFQNRTSHLLSGDKSIHSALNIIVKDMGIVTSVGRKNGVPLFLSSATEQVLNKGVGDGYGLEDDAYLYRVYLPKPKDNTQSQTTTSTSISTKDSTLQLQLIDKMLKHVHLAATAEALKFGSDLGLDGRNLYHIVEGAAGASAMFIKAAPDMFKGDVRGGEGDTSPTISQAITDLSAVVAEASRIKFPLYLTATALQMFQSLAAKGMGEHKASSIINFWV